MTKLKRLEDAVKKSPEFLRLMGYLYGQGFVKYLLRDAAEGKGNGTRA